MDVVNLPPSSSVARDLKSGYELLIGKNDDISSSTVVLFVAQKPKPEDIQMVKGLKGLGLKITIVALGNGFDMREWLNMEGTIPLPDGGKDGVDVIEIIDKIIDEANKGEFFLSKVPDLLLNSFSISIDTVIGREWVKMPFIFLH